MAEWEVPGFPDIGTARAYVQRAIDAERLTTRAAGLVAHLRQYWKAVGALTLAAVRDPGVVPRVEELRAEIEADSNSELFVDLAVLLSMFLPAERRVLLTAVVTGIIDQLAREACGQVEAPVGARGRLIRFAKSQEGA